MSVLSKKYGLSEGTIKNMVKDGILPCSVIRCDEILSVYQTQIDAGVPKSEAVKRASDYADVTSSYVYRLINRNEKQG